MMTKGKTGSIRVAQARIAVLEVEKSFLLQLLDTPLDIVIDRKRAFTASRRANRFGTRIHGWNQRTRIE